MMRRGARWWIAGAGLALFAALAAANTVSYIGSHVGAAPSDRRYWDDTAMAVGLLLHGGPSAAAAPEPAPDASDPEDDLADDAAAAPEDPQDPADAVQQTVDAYRRVIRRAARARGIRPWEFWRTINVRAVARQRQEAFIPRYEDPGRARLLAWGWRILGGPAPFLLLWLGGLLALPAVAWAAGELGAGGAPWAGLAFAGLLGASPFVAHTLALPHSAVAFYLVALVVLAALSAHAALSEAPSRAGFLLRAAAAGLAFGLCAMARSGTLLIAPGFVLAGALALRRAWPARRVPAGVAALALFAAPYLVLRSPHHHNVWVSVWEGLGDFDQTHGYYWSDEKARQAIAAAGGRPFDDPRDVDPAAEALLRAEVLKDVRAEPGWYAGILARRVLATLSQGKLAPWGPRDGQSLEAPRFHYKYTRPVDWFGAGGVRFEVPVWVLWAPTAALALAWMAARRGRLRRVDPTVLGRRLAVLGPVALGALPVPVLISTASGIETQAFVLVYFLGTAFALQSALEWTRR